MKVLLIGGTGILSLEICRACLNNGYDTYCINRGTNSALNLEGVNTITADIRNQSEIIDKIEGVKFDVVVDFLSYTVPQLQSTLEIFKDKMSQYIFISSATVYNKTNEDEVIKEDTTPIGNPLWKYALNKTECENYLRSMSGLNYTIIRPYVTYGKNRIPFAVISEGNYWALANRIYLGKPIIMWDDGNAICTVTHSADFAKGVLGLMLNEKSYGEAFHITSTEQLTWNDVLAGIEKALGKKAEVIYIPSSYIEENMDMYRGALLGDKATNMRFNNEKISSVVPQFVCEISFDNGIKDTIDFYRNNNFMRKVDYKWDGLMDCMLEKFCKENKITKYKKVLKCSNYESDPSNMEKLKYFIARKKYRYVPISYLYSKSKKLLKK